MGLRLITSLPLLLEVRGAVLSYDVDQSLGCKAEGCCTASINHYGLVNHCSSGVNHYGLGINQINGIACSVGGERSSSELQYGLVSWM